MIRFFARHPTAANLLMLVMMAAGFLALPNLQRETIPDPTSVTVQVQVVYPGASPEEVYEEVVEPLTEALEGVVNLEELRSEARDSLALITAEMLDRGDAPVFQAEVEAAVSSVIDLPTLSEPPVVKRIDLERPGLVLAVSAPMDELRLKAYLEHLKERLLALDQISAVKVAGFSQTLLRIEVDREKLRRYGLSPAAVVRQVASQSRNTPLGEVSSNGKLLRLRFNEERRDAATLENLVIVEQSGGAQIRLAQIATVRRVLEKAEDRVELNGKRGGLLVINKTKSEDILKMQEATLAFIEEERQRQPLVEMVIVRDGADIVRQRLSLLSKNAVQGLILVFITLWIFFDLRLSFWVAMSLPASFLGAFAMVPFTGLTINMLTSTGLLLALGLLMDDGIVIAEAINDRRKAGVPSMKAAVEGTLSVGSGVFSSFITTMCVLGPLAFIDGDIGKILRVLPLMLILVVAVSLVEAFLILPSHLGHALKEDRDRGWRRHVDGAVDRFQERVLLPVVSFLVKFRYLAAGTAVGVFLATLGLVAGGKVGVDVFPELEGDVVVARLQMAPETPLKQTEAAVRHIEAALQATVEELSPEVDLIRNKYVEFGVNPDANDTGEHLATITVRLLPSESREVRLARVFDLWREKIGLLPDVVQMTLREPNLGPGGRDLEFRLEGVGLVPLLQASREVVAYLDEFDGVSNMSADVRRGQRQLELTQKPGALASGLDGAALSEQLRGAFQGQEAYQFHLQGIQNEVEVRFSDAGRTSDELESFQAILTNGEAAPLNSFVDQSVSEGWSRIPSIDGRLTVTVTGDLDPFKTTSRPLIAKVQKELLPELQKRYPGLRLRLAGRAEDGQRTGKSMARAGLIGLLGVFFLLSYQFRSYFEPLVVMVAIPFSLVGVIWGHYLFGLSITLPSVMGFLSLGGVVVNDSILLVLYLKELRAREVEIGEATLEASRRRLLPIFLTTITTIAGLSPLLFERSLQAQILIPLANAVCFGLMSATLLIVLAVPCLYNICHDFGLTQNVAEG